MQMIAAVLRRTDDLGAWLPHLGLRILLAWEYGEAGLEKLRGANWFAQVEFPFPFSVLPPEAAWALATWTELTGAALLLIGLATRATSAALIVLTVVAIAAVHWPDQWMTLADLARGYAITDHGFGNFKLPLLFIVMLVPLLLQGAGKASVDHWLRRRYLP